MLDMCSKPILCSKIALGCSYLLQTLKVAQKLPSTIGTGLKLRNHFTSWFTKQPLHLQELTLRRKLET